MLAAALERGAAALGINDTFAAMNGVRLRINPNPRLFVRVVDTEDPGSAPALEEEDIVPDVLRLLRRIPLLLAPEAQAVWHPAVARGLAMLSPKERDACRRFLQDVTHLVTPVLGEPGDPPSKP